MTDAPELPKPSGGKRRLFIYIGAGIGTVLILVGVAAGLVWKVEKFHSLWCTKVGWLCVKVVVKPPPVVPPAGCPDFKIRGSLRARGPNDPVAMLLADVTGKVSLNQGGWVASGDSNVTCSHSEFLASFTGMSHGVTYQCLGSIDGKTYAGVCNLSHGGPSDVSGEFGH